MDHSYYRDKISAYYDGALEHQERELIRRHLEECAECRSLLAKLNQLSAAIEEKSALKNDEYFEKLAQRIEQRIAAPREKVVDVRELRWKSFWWKISAAAASLILVGTIGYYQLRDDQEMPAKLLDDIKINRESVTVNTDSVSADEVAEYQGGRSDGKEIAAKVAESETSEVKKEKRNAPVKEEKDKQIVLNEDLNGKNTKFAPTGIVALKPSELKEKAPEVESASLEKADSVEVVVDKADESMMFDFVGDSVAGQQLALAQWRSQRDSIQNVLGLEQDTVVNSVNYRLKELAAPSVSGMVKVDDSNKVYQALANSWFQIALQTQDDQEKSRAIRFLNWYKNRFPADSPMVNQQLQQISN